MNPRNEEKDGKPLRARLGERLDQATALIEGDAIGDPLTVARMQLILGQSQLGLGYPEKAIGLFSAARATFTRLLGPDHPDTLTSMGEVAGVYRCAGELDRALPLFEEILSRAKSKLDPGHSVTLGSISDLALAYLDAGQFERAVPLLEETYALKKLKLGPEDPDTLVSMNNLADGYQEAGKLDRALPLYEKTYTLRKLKLGRDHPDTLLSMNNLASGYRQAGRLDLAVPLYEEVHGLIKSKLGLDHPDTLTSINNLASGYWSVKRLDRSIPLFEECLKLRPAKSGEDHLETFVVKANLGVNYGTPAGWPRRYPCSRKRIGPFASFPDFVLSADDSWKHTSKPAGTTATALASEMLATDRTALPAGSPQLAGLLDQVGSSMLNMKIWPEAEAVLHESLTIRVARNRTIGKRIIPSRCSAGHYLARKNTPMPGRC